MGSQRLWLLLLVSTCAFAQQGDDGTEEQIAGSCLKDGTRFKNLKKYVYRYEAESLNGVAGTATLRNGPKITCKVELEVPQSCSFILHSKECTLSEVALISPDGKLVFRQAANSDDFRDAMAKNTLKFSIPDGKQVYLYPSSDEPTNILNIKRGMITALMAPVESEKETQTVSMDTVYGACEGEMTVVNRKGDIASEITVTRDLSSCKNFSPMRDYASPIALITGMHTPLSTLISSSQSCKYGLDSKRKHVLDAVCNEKHVFLPFSQSNEYGITSQVKQTFKFQDSGKINNRYFDPDATQLKPLKMESTREVSPKQSAETVLNVLHDVRDLPETSQGHLRPSLFQKIVTELRGLNTETIESMVPKMSAAERTIITQALLQCGTPDCFSGIRQVLTTSKVPAPVIDAMAYSIGLLPSPCTHRIRDLLKVAQYQKSRATFYALSNSVRRFYETENVVTPEVTDTAEFMTSLLGSDCSGDDDSTFLTLKTIGNMGKAMENANPKLKSSLLKCVKKQSASFPVQLAAIQAFRKMTLSDEVRSILLQTFQDSNGQVQKRIAAYLMLMKDPSSSDLAKVARILVKEKNDQVRNFVATHIANILESDVPSLQQMKTKVEESLKGVQVPDAMDFRKFSGNYHSAKKLSIPYIEDYMEGSIQGNLIFDPSGYMPREAMLETTLTLFEKTFDIFEFGINGKDFEPTLESLFGEKGFFPDTVMKALYLAEKNLPEVVNRWFGTSSEGRMKREIPKDIITEITNNAQKLMEDLKSQNVPETTAYLRILGAELGYMKLNDFKTVMETIMSLGQELKGVPDQIMKAVTSGSEADLFIHYLFMDNEFSLPSGAGFPLKFSLSGVFTPGARAGLKIDPKMGQVTFRPSATVEFITRMGIHIPEYGKSAIEMHSNLHHESDLTAKVSFKGTQVQLSIPTPQKPMQLIAISNRLLSVSSSQTETVPPIVEGRVDKQSCYPVLYGLQFCSSVLYSNASTTNEAPYFPLTGETRFALEIRPTNEVSEYSATLGYELLKEDRDKVDTVRFILKAEGTPDSELAATLKFNRNKMTVTGDLQIPDCDVEVGVNLGVSEEGMMKGKRTFVLNLGLSNKKKTELSLVGRARYNGKKEGMLSAQLTMPRLKVDIKSSATIQFSDALTVQLEASSNFPHSSTLQSVVFKYDKDKVEVETKSDIKSNLKELLPNFDNYQSTLQKYADDILDQKVAKTDMKLRHIVSKSIEASNIWLDRIAKEYPYVEKLRSRRSTQDLTLPELPEQLYLKTNSLSRYQFNKDKLTFKIPLPFGGKTSEELNIPDSFSTPPVVIPNLGIRIPATTRKIPAFSIPETYEVSVPLLGVAEFSTAVTSNVYNWSASITGGNQTLESPYLFANYEVKAKSVVDLLSYNIKGAGLVQFTTDSATYSINGSLHHGLLDASFSYIEFSTSVPEYSGTNNFNFEASSILGVRTSGSSNGKLTIKENIFVYEEITDGKLMVGELYGKVMCNSRYTFDKNTLDVRGETTTNLDSSLLLGSNRLAINNINGQFSIKSATDISNGALQHVGEINFQNGQLLLKSDSRGNYYRISGNNKIDIALSYQAATLRAETQAEYYGNRWYLLTTGAVNENGIEMNADGRFNVDSGRGAHKATAALNQNGLVTSATTNIQCGIVTFEEQFNSRIDASGATLSLFSKGSSSGNTIELSVDGKMLSTEISMNTVHKINIMDVSSRNLVNMKVNKEGLAFSNSMMGSYNKMKIEHTHTLNIALWTIAFRSKTDNLFGPANAYKHDVNFNIKPFVVSLTVNNDLKLLGADLNNDGQFKLEPYKLSLTGNMKGAYGKDQEVKHTYKITYAELTGLWEASTTGRVQGAQLSNVAKLEVAGLSGKFNSDTRLTSKALRFENVIRTLFLPFTISVDAITNGDGSLYLYGDHNGNLYSKFLMKAEPLAFTYSHDYRGSTTHKLENRLSANTLLENKLTGLFTPSEQTGLWKMKTQLNNHIYSQDITAYNNPEKAGVELSGQISTDILNKFTESNRFARDLSGQPQEFVISGFLKYDKNKDMHTFELPFLESLPALFDQIKATLVTALESLQKYLKSLNINEVLKKYRNNMDKLPQQLNDYVNSIDLERKVQEAKEQLMAFTKEYAVTVEDLEKNLENIKNVYKDALTKLQKFLESLKVKLKEGYKDLIPYFENVSKEMLKQLKAYDQQYEITKTTLNSINAIQDIIQKYDLEKLKSSSAAWLQNLDAKYQIKAEFYQLLENLKRLIQNFDAQKTLDDLKSLIKSMNIEKAIDGLKISFDMEEVKKMLDAVKDMLLNAIEDYEITEKINSAFVKIQQLLVKYEVEQKLKTLMDKAVLLAEQYKIKETVQSAVNSLKRINIKSTIDAIMQYLENTIKWLKERDYKQFIDQLNSYIDVLLKSIRAFDYNKFVDDTNKKISDATRYMNEQIKTLEIPQKIEASRQFVKNVQAAAYSQLEQISDTRIAEIINWLRDLLDSTAFSEIKKRTQEYLEDLRHRISTMDIQKELKYYLQRASELYNRMVNYLADQWDVAQKTFKDLAEQYNAQNLLSNIKKAIEEGFTFPEMQIGSIRIPAFEISLNALKRAEFLTPEFILPFTNLRVPSVKFNLLKLGDIQIPMKFTIPPFTVLDTYEVSSYTIDLNEIKREIIKILERISNFRLNLPEPEAYFKDLKLAYLSDMPELTFPEIRLSEISFPELTIPKLDLNGFSFSELQIPEFHLPSIPHDVSVPVFGKLYGEFKIKSPVYSLTTSAQVWNSTTNLRNPEFVASVTSQATSTFNYLAFTLDANARLSAPKMKSLQLTDTIKVNHKAFSFDHNGALSFLGASVEGTSETTAKATTKAYTAEANSKSRLKMQSGIEFETQSRYSHNLNLPEADLSSQTSLQQNTLIRLESGIISLKTVNTGSGKWSVQDFSDDFTHNSDFDFNINIQQAKLSFTSQTNSKYLKMKNALSAESVILSHANFDFRTEVEAPQIKSGVLEVSAKALASDLRLEVKANHNTELNGRATGKIINSFNFLAQPFEISLTFNNNANTKISFPLKLTGKIDLQNNYELTLNSGVQQFIWIAGARFNQYRYFHNVTISNNENNVGVFLAMNGEGNLEFLNVPISIPDITVPYISVTIPAVHDVSLWQDMGLKDYLLSPKQSFDLIFKVQYEKNKDVHSIPVNLEPLYKMINDEIKAFNYKFEVGRDKAVKFMTDSYNQAKEQYDRFKIDTSANRLPRIFKIPGYTVPVLNIEVSQFTAELPAFSFIIPKEVKTPSLTVPMIGFSMPSYTLVLPSLELPILHVPATLRKLAPPKFKLPRLQNSITIPAMGNLTYDFALKSTVITVNANAGLYNQSDIIGRLGFSSSSAFDILNFKLEGTTGLTRKRGLKLATALSATHNNIAGTHDSTVSLTKKSMEATVTTNVQVKLPMLNIEFNQDLNGNSKSKPNVASKINVKYNFNVPQIDTKGEGIIEHNLALEGLTSYISLESSTKGKIDGTYTKMNKISGNFNNEANTYLNSNGLRSTMKTEGKLKADSNKKRILNFELNENVALEASLRRIYALLNYSSNNEATCSRFNTKGQHFARATFELIPSSLAAHVQIDISQPNSYFQESNFFQSVILNVNPDLQKISWNGKEQMVFNILTHDVSLSNDKKEIHVDASGSVQGHASFLGTIIFPVYHKSLWSILKFDLTTSEEKLQYLNASTSLIYTKNNDGYFFPLPISVLPDGITLNIPEVTLQVPKWIKKLPQKIREIDIPTENFKIPDKVSVPSVIEIPSFKVPFTTLQMPQYTIDFKKMKLPKKISTLSFDVILPYMPKIKFPKVDIATRYLQDLETKLPQLSVKVPDFAVGISSFTLPKSFSIGSRTIQLDNAVNQIANFDLPTITIPEQKIDIPEISIALPAGLAIPVFGTLFASVEVASPIYNMSWTASLANKTSVMESSIKSTCNSTLMFLEYDLEASTTASYENEILNLIGKCTFAHSDFSIDGKHQYAIPNRMKRQANPNSSGTQHTMSIDIKSPTFTDVSVRYEGRSDIITASVSSPSSGFLGLLLEKRVPETIHGRVYGRYPSSNADVVMLDGEMTLQTPEDLKMHVTWNADAANDVLTGLKERIPRMTSSVYNCVNKYHRQQLGLDINHASAKVKDSMQGAIGSLHNKVMSSLDVINDELQKTMKSATSNYIQMKDETNKLYKRAVYNMNQIDLQDLRLRFYDSTSEMVRLYQIKIRELIDAAIKFLKVTKFQIPGFNEKYTGQELFNKAPYMIDQMLRQISLERHFEALVKYIEGVEFEIPGTDIIIRGKVLTDSIKQFLRQVQDYVIEQARKLRNVNLEKQFQKLKDCVQSCTQKIEEMIQYMRSKSLQDIQDQFQGMYNDAINSPTAEQIIEVLENMKLYFTDFYNFSKTGLVYILENLEKASFYLKSLREEYLDANMVGWTVKYYEIEEKIINSLQKSLEYVKEEGPKYIEQVAQYTTNFIDQIKRFILEHGNEYFNYAKDLLDTGHQGKQLITDLSDTVQKNISQYMNLFKRYSYYYSNQAKQQLQEAYDSLSLDRITSEIQNIIDLIIEKYTYVYQVLLNHLEDLKNDMKPYIKVHEEDIRIDIPLPFLWESFDSLPKSKDR
ncbi:apolipoprotein B-100 [Erpetoichthys calabaricus]|nr:apolipoprotein B-100 [Erpetoichthys calabaricus]